jgi:outer membrane protein
MKNYLLIFFALTSPALNALTITWEEALKYTIEGNPQLEAAKNEWLASQSNEQAAFGNYLPKLSASTSITKSGSERNGGGAVVQNGVVLNSGSTSNINTNYIGSLNLNQNIFNGLEDSSRYDQAKWRTQNSYWSYLSMKASLSLSLKEAYANLVYAQETVTLTQSILERRESNFKLVSVRYENGRENKGSVLLAEAYYEQAQLDVIKAKDGLGVALQQLKSLMNKNHLEKFEVEGEVPLIGLEIKNKELSELVLETPAYNQALAQEMIAKEDIDIARSSFLPSLDFSGNVVRQGTTYFPDRERWTVALTLSIPIFDGLKDKNTLKASVFSKYAAEGKKKSTLLDLLPRLADAQNLAKQSDIKFRIDEKFRKASTTRAEIARAKYNNGLITFEDWDIIENELIQRQTNYLQSKKDRVVRYATWENLLGRGAIQ